MARDQIRRGRRQVRRNYARRFIMLRYSLLRYSLLRYKTFDWRKRIRRFLKYDINQGNDLSCFAAAALGAVEANVLIYHQQNIRLSLQQILDFCPDFNTINEGGLSYVALDYMKKVGVSREAKNPYTGLQKRLLRSKCRGFQPVVRVEDFRVIKRQDITASVLKEEVRKGPVIISIFVNEDFEKFQGKKIHDGSTILKIPWKEKLLEDEVDDFLYSDDSGVDSSSSSESLEVECIEDMDKEDENYSSFLSSYVMDSSNSSSSDDTYVEDSSNSLSFESSESLEDEDMDKEVAEDDSSEDFEDAYYGHDVLLIGYGISWRNIPFWIIRNSFGRLWGHESYMRLHQKNTKKFFRAVVVDRTSIVADPEICMIGNTSENTPLPRGGGAQGMGKRRNLVSVGDKLVDAVAKMTDDCSKLLKEKEVGVVEIIQTAQGDRYKEGQEQRIIKT